MLSKLLGSRRRSRAPTATIPDGQRVYAIGDVHGCLDQLDRLLADIDRDDAARPPADTTIIVLGDLVDRGPHSAQVIARLRARAGGKPAMRFLMGNHEEVFLSALTGDAKALKFFCRIGGRETIMSYGLSADAYEQLDYAGLHDWMMAHVPLDDRVFLSSFEDMIVIGDYAFVHAGVRPGVPLAAQTTTDLRWIREPFLDFRGTLEKRIVHGHTIVPDIVVRPHRIGLDTGAYTGGALSAIGLYGDAMWELNA
ncbi:serine/threonine protein phosphatase [Sphingomonas sp. Leaf17]|uniref:metallophosphoesterase family protein n=1 Tax=Sphingomonas sp. Leaf17 TaxID=1735683 RepID=UPI0006F786BD|nr:metallophosphoesterase family protein [Sphingomonas sp. Leaf17]KQM63764.1 serine/threonine protein phosphatase [Sphingomonas sp. Leaf17]